jgi:hypothetical protein
MMIVFVCGNTSGETKNVGNEKMLSLMTAALLNETVVVGEKNRERLFGQLVESLYPVAGARLVARV